MPAKLKIKGGGVTIEAQFNPAEYTLSKGVQVEEQDTKKLDAAVLEFTRGGNVTLGLTLLFDATLADDAVDVVLETDKCYRLALIEPKKTAPPVVTVTWGEFLSFKAYVDKVDRQFTLFDEDGVPLRATVTLSFKEYLTIDELDDLKQGKAAPHTSRHVTQRGDTAAAIAAQQYGDPAQWRKIAEANPGVADSLPSLPPGTVLQIPPLAGS